MANKHLGRAKPSSQMYKRGYTIHLINEKAAKPQEAPTPPAPPIPPAEKKDEEKG